MDGAQQSEEPASGGTVAALQQQVDQLREDQVQANSQQVISLAQAEASEVSILAALEVLVQGATRNNHKDAQMFQNLRAKALIYRQKISVGALVLEVLAQKGEDRVSSALAKVMKEEKGKKQQKVPSEEVEVKVPATPDLGASTSGPSPLPQYAMPYNMYNPTVFSPPMSAMSYQQPMYGLPNQGPRFKKGYRNQRSSNSYACHFCGAQGHFLKDCEVLKKLKEKK